jgi:hypothetical protein
MTAADSLDRAIAEPCRGGRYCRFTPARTALRAIDMQQEFFIDGECLDEMRAILPRVERVLAGAG